MIDHRAGMKTSTASTQMRRGAPVANGNVLPFPYDRTVGHGFASAKTGREIAGIAPLDVDLACMLEAEPCILTYDSVGNGLFEASVLGDPVLLAIVPTHGGADEMAIRNVSDRTGLPILRVPERVLRTRPYVDNARLIARSGGYYPSAFARIAILDALLASGDRAPLGDLCACADGVDDPIAAVLSLVPAGVLSIDMSKPIDANSEVVRIANADIDPDAADDERPATLLDVLAMPAVA